MNRSVKENIKGVYKKYAKEFDEKIGSLTIYNESYDYLLNHIEDGASILDLACGPGNVSYYLKNKKPGLSITGVDISEEIIDIAKRKIQDGEFIVKDICEVKFETKFDCVVCAFAIPYLNLGETDHVAKTISRSLKSNGLFYISFIEGSKEGYEKTSFTENDKLFVYHHPQKAIFNILDKHALSVIKKFEIDYHEEDGTITDEVIYVGNKSHSKSN